MLATILRAVATQETVSLGELERRLGLSRESLLRALADLTRAGFLALDPPEAAPQGCASACAGCRALPGCASGVWRLTEKSQRMLAIM
jgi:hypothetical protein